MGVQQFLVSSCERESQTETEILCDGGVGARRQQGFVVLAVDAGAFAGDPGGVGE